MGPRETLVLAALAISVGDVVSADQLADAVWGDTPPASWHKNLQTCIVRLRKSLGADAIETVGHGYRLTLPADVIDARRFEALVARGRELAMLGEPERAAYTLGQALALWRGRPLEELEDWEPGSLEAARLTDLRLDAQEWWLEGMVEAGRYRDVLTEAGRWSRRPAPGASLGAAGPGPVPVGPAGRGPADHPGGTPPARRRPRPRPRVAAERARGRDPAPGPRARPRSGRPAPAATSAPTWA